mmetsp:Transcript_5359/g.8988  ORF Transcript_5359/g.8988 Transcript_5359/m.8988 type:complete len:174 (+) Transcript_5359:3-524(+)
MELKEDRHGSLGALSGPLYAFIHSSGYHDSCSRLQNRLVDANYIFNSLYGSFDWSTNVTESLLKLLIVAILLTLGVPSKYITLVIFLYLMLMRTTAWGFFMKLISFFVHVLTSHKQRHINQEGKRIPSILKANRHSHELTNTRRTSGTERLEKIGVSKRSSKMSSNLHKVNIF